MSSADCHINDSGADVALPPSLPCKLEYLSDSDDCDDFDSDSSGDEPDFFFRSEDEDIDTSDNNGSRSSRKNEVNGSPQWRDCSNKIGLSTQKNISFCPPRKGINDDLVPLNSTPLQCLQTLMTDTIIEAMVTLINERGGRLFAKQAGDDRNGNNANESGSESECDEDAECNDEVAWKDMTLGEMYKYMLVLVSMSIHARPGMNSDYIWGKNYIFSGEWFNKIMPKQRFFKIAKLIREVFDFSDVNRRATVRGMVRWIMKNSQSAFYPNKHLNVEEMVVGTPKRGWTHINHDTGNPHNHRVKTLGLIDNETSYIVDLFLCYGPSKKCYNPAKLDEDFTKKMLDQLLSSCCKGHHLYLSKYYSSIPILNHLEQKFYYIGHIDEKRHWGIPQDVKSKKKLEVGEMKWYIDEDDKNLIARYRDTKHKLTSALISNHAEVKTEFSQGMTMPAMFHNYNLTIKGIERVHDAMDQFGHFQMPEKRWERKFFQWLFEIIQLNAFVLYKQSQPGDVKVASLYKFKRILANELCCLAGELYNKEPDVKRVNGCLCYRFDIPDMPKRKEEEDNDLD